MKHLNEFADRRKAAAEAKQLLLKKFENAPKPTDPEMQAKRAEREAVAAARAARQAERARVKLEEQDRKLAEAAAVAQAAEAAEKALQEESNNRIARVIADEAERKAERDRRYAARKARQR